MQFMDIVLQPTRRMLQMIFICCVVMLASAVVPAVSSAATYSLSSASPIAFSQVDETPVTKTLTLTVEGSGTLDVVRVNIEDASDPTYSKPAKFSVDGDECEDAAPMSSGETCMIYLEFSSREAYYSDARLYIKSNSSAGEELYTNLEGTLSADLLLSSAEPSGWYFGGVVNGEPKERTFSVRMVPAYYSGSGIISSITGADAAEFVITNDGCAMFLLIVNTSCTVEVTFTPSAIRRFDATLTVDATVGTHSESIALLGYGVVSLPTPTTPPPVVLPPATGPSSTVVTTPVAETAAPETSTDPDRETTGSNRGEVIRGGRGNDRLTGGSGDDRISGGNGRDRISGSDGFDSVYGGAGNDWLSGGAGNDALRGESGNDTLTGGSDPDVLYGGSGNDTIYAQDGKRHDRILCGKGNDTVYADRGDKVSGECEKVIRR